MPRAILEKLMGFGDLVLGQRNTVFKNVSLLAFRPVVSQGSEAFEILLFNHIWEKSLGSLKHDVCEVPARAAPSRLLLSYGSGFV